jgi:zinc protease
LYQALVEKDLATNAGAGEEENMGPGLFQFNIGLPNGVDIAQVEPVLDAAIARIQTDGVTDEELETAKVQERVDAIRGLQTSMGRAQRLGLYAVIFHDPNRVNTLLPSLENVTAADVQRVARKYLVKENRSVVISQPAGATPAAQGGTQ